MVHKTSQNRFADTFLKIKGFTLAKILFITSRFPYPINKGDKLRVYFQLKHLSAEHEIHLISIDERLNTYSQTDTLKSFCASLHTYRLPRWKRLLQLIISPFSGLPLQVAFFYNNAIKLAIEKISDEIQPDHIHCHLIRTTEYVKDIKHIKKSLDFMDAFGKGMERRKTTETNILKRILFAYEQKRLYHYEAKVFDFIDRFCIISNQDKREIKHARANEIIVIPNGVDFETFYPKETEKKYDLVFMGNLDYPPNVDAIQYIATEILPELKKLKPKISILIAGANAPRHIKNLQSNNLEIIESFPNISDAIAMSKIMIAPMKLSIGLQNKIIQAMAMKIPCIVSTLANNAIEAPINEAVIEANTVREYLVAIVELLDNEMKANRIASNGFNFVRENFCWLKQNEKLSGIISSS
jgi:polysaccharide biosynthesis protein PslH